MKANTTEYNIRNDAIRWQLLQEQLYDEQRTSRGKSAGNIHCPLCAVVIANA